MRYREYKFLKILYNMNPEMNDNQKFESHLVSNIINNSKFDEKNVIYFINELSKLGYVNTYHPLNETLVASVNITIQGFACVKYYWKNKTFDICRNIVVPALVSIICSLAVWGITV